MKILITGGHITPALAVVEELQGQEIVFVGRKYALEHEKTLSFEYKEVQKKGLPFIDLSAGRINKGFSLRGLISILKIPYGFYQALHIVRKQKPDVVLSFGSYLAVPIAWWANIFSIPVYLHEQTSVPGRANRLIGKFARKVFVSFPETERFFPQARVVLSGNPIRSVVTRVLKKPFDIEKKDPVIYVTGGSLGSHSINSHIQNLLKKLTSLYTVIHQVGDTKQYNDFEKLSILKNDLPEPLRKKYILQKHFMDDEIGYVYSVSDVVVGRAGANTFFELIYLKKPTVFIPLPWSAGREQQKQAEIFKTAEVGEVFNQTDSSKLLFEKIQKIVNEKDLYVAHFSNLDKLYNENAAHLIADEILKK